MLTTSPDTGVVGGGWWRTAGEQAGECWCHACAANCSEYRLAENLASRGGAQWLRDGPASALGLWQPSGGYQQLRDNFAPISGLKILGNSCWLKTCVQPLGEDQEPPPPRKSHGDHRTLQPLPENQAYTQKPRGPLDGRAYIRPLPEHQVLRLPQKPQSPQDHEQHPTACRAPSPARAMQKPRRPQDARAYIRPLAKHQVLRLPRKSHGDHRTRGRSACHAKATETSDHRAYIRPLAKHQVLRLCKSHEDHRTPARTSDPLQSTKMGPTIWVSVDGFNFFLMLVPGQKLIHM